MVALARKDIPSSKGLGIDRLPACSIKIIRIPSGGSATVSNAISDILLADETWLAKLVHVLNHTYAQAVLAGR